MSIAYRNPGESAYTFFQANKTNMNYRDIKANFNFYPIIYITTSSSATNQTYIMKFNIASNELTTLASFVLKNPATEENIASDFF